MINFIIIGFLMQALAKITEMFILWPDSVINQIYVEATYFHIYCTDTRCKNCPLQAVKFLFELFRKTAFQNFSIDIRNLVNHNIPVVSES